MARPSDPQRRDDILQAARTVLLTEGYVGARMAEIAQRAGVAPGTLYLYFPSKEAIVAALVERYYERLTAEVIPMMGQPDVAAAIAQTVETVFRFMAADRDLLKLARLEVGLRKPLAREGYSRLPAHLQLQRELVRVLRARMAEGAIRQYDADALAELLDGLFERIADLYLFTEGGDVNAYKATLLAFLRAALLL